MIDTVDKFDLIGVARAVEVMRYTIQDMRETYFEAFNAANKEDHWKIVYEFDRNRMRADILNEYLFNSEKMLEELNITWRDNGA